MMINTEPLAFGTLALLILIGYFSNLGFNRPGFSERYMFDPHAVLEWREWRRLVTSGFLHLDWMHFAFNAFSMYSFGRHIELVFGFGYVAIIFFSSVIGGNLLALWIHRRQDYRALGASGGVCGVIYASIFLLPGGSVRVFLFPVAIPSYVYAVLFLLISAYGFKAGRDNIGHDAHIGGAVVGLLVTTALRPSIVLQSPLEYFLVLGISAAVLYFLTAAGGTFSLSPITSIARRMGGRTAKKRHVKVDDNKVINIVTLAKELAEREKEDS